MLTTVEYQEIMERRGVLEGIMEGGARDEEKFKTMAKAARARTVDAKERLLLYINFLSDAVKEYEDAQPVEEAK